MAIRTGQRLGPYEILSAIGAGGMGEVYRARDTRLDRIVAIKILSDHIADRAALRERFDREARTVASLNHSHICTLFDIGHQDGTDYLVMEYLEGETLADRLKKGPLPLAQVFQYAIEIADALDKAHRKGVIHRDLKPGNIMLTKSGVKLLDFGLAKLRQEATPVAPLSQRPTAESGITAEGTILGTLQYMAPEQVEGKTSDIDARTDIFAFGVVVYEMATGKKAFEGKTSASLIAKILETEPVPMSSLQPMTPPALDRMIKRCLTKDPDERWQSARDICEQLRWISDTGSAEAGASSSAVARRNLNMRLVWMTLAVAILVTALVSGLPYLRPSPPEVRPVRFSVGPPEKQVFPVDITLQNYLSVSPDGSKLAYIAVDSTGHSMLWVRDLDSQAAQPLAGTDGAGTPFWSPDSRFIAFTAGNTLKKVSVSGGPPQTITASPAGGGGTWNRDGVILFVPSPASGILRVSSAGGSAATPVTSLEASDKQLSHTWPYFLPDGKHFLYSVTSVSPGNSAIYVRSLDSKTSKLLLPVYSMVLYSPPGYLLFVRAGTLFAQGFDADRLELKGEAMPIAENVQSSAGGRAAIAVSRNGVLAYRSVPSAGQFRLLWVNRKGVEQALLTQPQNYRNPRLSPDGQRVSITIDDQEWLLDLGRGTLTRLTFEGGYNGGTTWTPDSKRITFGSNQAGQWNLFWQPVDGSGGPERLTTSGQISGSWSADGQTLAFETVGAATGFDIWIFHLADRKTEPFLQSRFNEIGPRFSPDGRWLAYASDESGSMRHSR